MKKLLLVFILALFCFTPISAQAAENGTEKVLIVYYSLSGRTKAVADRLQAKTGAELYEIRTVKTYSSTQPGLYEEPKRELKENDLPELVNSPPDMSAYDLILVGAPVWWYTVPTPLMKFLQDADFAGKRVASFCTYNSTLGQYHPHFAQQAKNADVKEGIALSYPHRIPERELDERLDNWLRLVREQ
ncbi:MAG: NAD(P)H-dependent oxidoreductase [Planctomycetes bacterium]|nr:NAD(P)H-dependent oxidoreductase [Planctomycetota bacterium]